MEKLDDDTMLALLVIAGACTAFCAQSETYPVWRKFGAGLGQGSEPPDQEALVATAKYLTQLAERYDRGTSRCDRT